MLLLSLPIEILFHQLGLLEMLKSCGKIKYPTDFLVLASPKDDLCPIIFGKPFLNTVHAKIDCEKQTIDVSFGDESHEFNFPSLVESFMKKICLVKMN